MDRPRCVVCTLGVLFIAGVFFAAQGLAATVEKTPLMISGSALIGYDNNANLDSQRKSDGFGQQTVRLDYRQWLTERVRARISGDVLNINYFEAIQENIFAPSGGTGLDVIILPDTILESDYHFEYDDFTNDDDSTSVCHEGRVGLLQRFNKKLSGGIGLGFLDRPFVHRKINLGDGLLSATEDRQDKRIFTDAQLRYRYSEAVTLRCSFEYLVNDSNVLYHDYYDYDMYRLSVGAAIAWNKRLSSPIRVFYDKRYFANRTLTDDPSRKERDMYYGASAELFYKIDRNLSLGAVYTYRQKDSIEPSQTYSGSIVTLGLYFNF